MEQKFINSCTIYQCFYPALIVFIITFAILGILQIFVYGWIVGNAKKYQATTPPVTPPITPPVTSPITPPVTKPVPTSH